MLRQMLDARSERTIAQVAEQAQRVFGADLVSVVLYGSAAGADFVPGRSDLNLAIVLERVTFGHLKALHAHLSGWRKRGVATPLLLDRRFLERACDVFPMEFYDIHAQHRLLYGEPVFDALRIDARHLRYQSEHEARSKLLRLRALYAEVGAQRRSLEALLLDSVKTFVVIMHNLLRLRGGDGTMQFVDIVDACERQFQQPFPTMRHLVRLRHGMEPWADDVEATVQAYFEEVERLVDLIDVIAVPSPAGACGPEAGG
jgi:predicted nucleotidyltransferase